MAKKVLQDGIDLIQPHLTPPPTAGTSTDYSDKIKTSAQQQKDLESGAAMAGNIVPVSVPVPINSGGQGGGQNPVQIFTPLHPAIHKKWINLRPLLKNLPFIRWYLSREWIRVRVKKPRI